ncbi:MAG: transglutaminase domain-containing protein [Planctomycetota bacterium]|nr:transglutaminase domain-containing protein [Planctomycetota bacterium]
MQAIIILTILATSQLAVAIEELPDLRPFQETTGEKTDWWSDAVEQRLVESGANRAELQHALNRCPAADRKAVAFLVEHMPQRDLQTLSAQFLLDEVRQASQARASAPWKISDELFLNDVLPYANVDETRESWRSRLREICQPIVADCQTPAEAAQRLNQKLFGEVQVRYSTQRKRANQSPSESIDQGLASCTGLSILLVDACRSVGVPARLAGIPSWPNKRGNHTWVEVWDNGWHFTGAAEPSGQGLNHTWFQGDAALAKKDSKLNAIYAVSFKKTGTVFPMVWSQDGNNPVYAVNVTDRYTKKKSDLSAGMCRVSFRVWNEDRSERIAAQVRCSRSEAASFDWSGTSKAGTADMNDMLSFDLDQRATFALLIEFAGKQKRHQFQVGDKTEQLVEVVFPEDEQNATAELDRQVDQFFAVQQTAGESSFEFSAAARQAYADNPAAMRQRIWQRYLNSDQVQKRFRSDYDANQVQNNEHLSPYTVKEVGKRPPAGWPLFIAMHGGGGAPAHVNDSQWKIMQRYYKDQPGVTGYKYLALRAPNNTWNGFYADYVYPLIENLVQQMVVLGDVDPNKVFIMGYSHGGYGAFAIGPKIPYRFAAVHSSAAAPTGGETSAKTLRNTRFTFMVGENDNAYGRRERCEAFAKEIKQLQQDHPGEYPVEFLYKPGFGHGGLPDRDMIAEMYEYTRVNQPKNLTWQMTDTVIDQFDWISVENPGKGKMVEASIDDNQITVSTENVDTLTVWLDSRLIDPARPVTTKAFGKTETFQYQPDLAQFCQSLSRTGDLHLSYDFRIDLNSAPTEQAESADSARSTKDIK